MIDGDKFVHMLKANTVEESIDILRCIKGLNYRQAWAAVGKFLYDQELEYDSDGQFMIDEAAKKMLDSHSKHWSEANHEAMVLQYVIDFLGACSLTDEERHRIKNALKT